MIDAYAWLIGLLLVAWCLTGGADLGAGVWDLLARGPRAADQRRLIEHAIAPIWEANHIWLILVVVLLFSVFPTAFAAVGTALHIPLTIALLGIVLRGSAFVFRSYGLSAAGSAGLWGRVFAISSVATPVALGLALGGLGTGAITLSSAMVVTSGFLAGWTTPFAVSVGLLTPALFALLAAVYLALEAAGELRADFVRRALWAEGVAFLAAAASLGLAYADAPLLFARLLGSPWSLSLQLVTALAAITVVLSLRRGAVHLARVAVGAQVAGVVLGFGLAMDGDLLRGALPASAAGARSELMGPLAGVLAAGAAMTIPALLALYRVFSRSPRNP